MHKYLKLLFLLPTIMSAKEQAGEYVCRYWFDNNSTQPTEITMPGQQISIEANTSGLTDGLHTLHLMVADGNDVMSSVKSSYFIRLATPGVYTVQTLIDGEPYGMDAVNCGVDGLIHLNIDASGLKDGLHHLSASVINSSGSMSSYQEAMFYKVPTNAEIGTMKVYYSIDGQFGGIVDANTGTGLIHLDLDVNNLTTGIHVLNTFMADGRGLHSDFRSAYFAKIPENGGAIKEYRYWVNNEYENTVTVSLEKSEAQLHILGMFEMPPTEFSSRSFACLPEQDGSLTLMANNTLNMLFFGEGAAVISGSADYIDPRVQCHVDASEINTLKPANNSTMTLQHPGDNKIKWYRCDVEPGALLSVSADRACSIDVFTSSGDKVYSASGVSSTTSGNIEAVETGSYYLAVHDFAPTVSQLRLSYTLMNRHSVALVTPERSSNQGTLFVDLCGNGFDELKAITLSSTDMSIPATYVGMRDKYNAIARFDLDSISAPIAEYDVVAQYVDSVTYKTESVVLPNAILLEEAGVPEIITKIEPSYRAATPYEVYIKVTNNSNVPCSFVPFNLAITASKGRRIISFKDFYPYRLSTGLSDVMFNSISHTDNLLGTHVGGFLFPTMIPYIGAHETITLTLGVTSETHDVVRMYAWSGEPWSEELKRLTSGNYQYTIEDFEQSNILSMTKIVIMQFMTLMRSQGLLPDSNDVNSVQTGPMKANMSTWGDDAVSVGHQLINKPNYAGTAQNLAKADAKLMGGIENGLRLNNLNAYQQVCGIDPSDSTYGTLFDYGDDLKQNMPHPAEILATAIGMEDEYGALQGYMDGCPTSNNPMPDPVDVDCMQSGDPNDITGYTSPSGSNFIGLDVKEVGYTIEFENDPKIANASAMTIDVTNTLDRSMFDLNSLVPGQLCISNKTLDLPNSHHFVKALDMRPEIDAVAEVCFDYDPSEGVAHWHLRSLDPMTMDDAEYRVQGILPVNNGDDHIGEGHVTYSIGLKSGLSHDTEIRNSASIVFDTNAPINTPEWVNVTDYERPEAMVVSSMGDDDSDYDFVVEGSDSGSGLWRYELYGMPPGTSQWRLLTDSEDTEFSYTPQRSLAGWRFTTLAVDGAGNKQDNKFMSMEFGDVNMSGSVDAHDVVLLTGYYVGQQIDIELRLADINGDNRIDAQDAVMAQTKYVQITNRNPRQRLYLKNK